MAHIERDRGFRRQMAERDRKRTHQVSNAGRVKRQKRTYEELMALDAELDREIAAIIGGDNGE